jgi:tetratricopeptide (TPR) repeat protein
MKQKAKIILALVWMFLLLSACASGNRSSIYKQAMGDYVKVTETDLRTAEAYNARGIFYMNNRYYQRAIEDFTRAIEIDQQFTDAYYNRSLAYSRLNYAHMAFQDIFDVSNIEQARENIQMKRASR